MSARWLRAAFPAATTAAGISHSLTYSVRKFRQAPGTAAPPALVEVPVHASSLVYRSGPPFRLHLGDGRLLEIEADFDAASLGRLLGVLEPGCCP